MGVSGNVKNKQERNQVYFDELMSEVSKSNPSNIDKVSNILMQHYSKKSRTPIEEVQEEFRKSLKDKTMATLKIDTQELLKDNKSKTNEELIKEEQIKEEQKNVQKVDSKNIDEKEGEELLTGDNLQGTKEEKEEVLAAMYATALDEYYNLKTEVDRELARDREIVAPNDRLYNRYIAYQKYIKDIDVYHKNISGSYISQSNKDINKKEGKFLRFNALGENKIEKNRSAVIDKATKLQEEIDKIQEEIISLNNSLSDKNISVEEYEYTLDNLQDKLMKKNVELDNMDPSIESIEKQDEEREEIDRAKDRIIGTHYDTKKSKVTPGLYGTKTLGKIEKTKEMDEVSDNKASKIINNKTLTTKELVDNYIKEAEEALEKGNIEGAKKLVEIAKETAGVEKSTDTKFKNEPKEDIEPTQKDEEKTTVAEKIFDVDDDNEKSDNSRSKEFKESLKEKVETEEEILRKDIDDLKGIDLSKDNNQIKKDKEIKRR